jgi:hypothetical protein
MRKRIDRIQAVLLHQREKEGSFHLPFLGEPARRQQGFHREQIYRRRRLLQSRNEMPFRRRQVAGVQDQG